MTTTTLSSREFNQDTGRAKKAALEGPAFITERAEPAYVFLSIEDYRKLTRGQMSVAEALAMPGDADFEFDPPRLNISFRPVDFE